MSKKSKKGSALITVLLFSLFFTIISGVSVLAVVNTLNGNSREEHYQTLYFEAEAGIEKAIELANLGEFRDNFDPSTGVDLNPGPFNSTIDSDKYSFDMNAGHVELSVEKKVDLISGDNYLQVESTATDSKGLSRVVRAKLKKWASTFDIFRYSICGSKVIIESGGAYDGSTSVVNASTGLIDNNIAGGVVIGKEESNYFEFPIFKKDDGTDSIPHQSEIRINTVNNVIGELNSLSSSGKIVKMVMRTTDIPTSIEHPGLASRGDFSIYLINTDKLIIEAAASYGLDSSIIMCSGDVELRTNGTADFSKTSIFGKNVIVKTGTLKVSNRPYDEYLPSGGGDEPLIDEDIHKIMYGYIDPLYPAKSIEGILHYAPNLLSGATGGGPTPVLGYSPSDYE